MQDIMQFIGRHPFLSIAWVALLIAVLYTSFKGIGSKVKNITRQETTRLINRENAIVVDIRLREDFRKGHIASSVNVPAKDIKEGNLGDLVKHKAQPVIVVDASGIGSQEVASSLLKAGFEQVYQLREGITGWNGENLPLIRSK